MATASEQHRIDFDDVIQEFREAVGKHRQKQGQQSCNLLQRGQVYFKHYQKTLQENPKDTVNNQTLLIGFCDLIVQNYTFQKESDPILMLFHRLKYITSDFMIRVSGEEDDVKRTRMVIKHILDRDCSYLTMLLLQALEVTAPKLSRQALNHLEGQTFKDQQLLQYNCCFCAMLKEFHEKLNDEVHLFDTVLKTRAMKDILEADQIDFLCNMELEQRMNEFLIFLQESNDIEKNLKFVKVVEAYNKALAKEIWIFLRDYYIIVRARRILEWYLVTLFNECFGSPSSIESLIDNLETFALIDNLTKPRLMCMNFSAEQFQALIQTLLKLQTVDDYERLFEVFGQYEKNIGREMSALLYLHRAERFVPTVLKWNSPKIHQIWNYSLMRERNGTLSLKEGDSLIGMGKYANLSNTELASVWYLLFLSNAGCSNGAIIQYPKIRYNYSNVWGCYMPEMVRIERKLLSIQDNSPEELTIKNELYLEPCPSVLNNYPSIGMCTSEQQDELDVLSSECFDMALQHVLYGKTINKHNRFRFKWQRRNLQPTQSVCDALHVCEYEDAFDGQRFLYRDGTLFSNDEEWRVSASVEKMAKARIAAQRLQLERILDYDPSFLLDPDYLSVLKTSPQIFALS